MTPTPAAGEIPSTERRALARRIGAAVSAPSGFVLALCFFMPAVEACDEVHYPFQYPLLAEPYVFGLAAAALAGFFLLRSRPLPRLGAKAFSIFTGLSIAAYGFFFFMEAANGLPEIRQPGAVLALLSLPAFVLSLWPPLRRREPLIAFARSLWTGGAISFLWFYYWWQDLEFNPERVFFGLYLSLLTSAFLALGGALLEWGARGQERVRDSSLRSE